MMIPTVVNKESTRLIKLSLLHNFTCVDDTLEVFTLYLHWRKQRRQRKRSDGEDAVQEPDEERSADASHQETAECSPRRVEPQCSLSHLTPF